MAKKKTANERKLNIRQALTKYKKELESLRLLEATGYRAHIFFAGKVEHFIFKDGEVRWMPENSILDEEDYIVLCKFADLAMAGIRAGYKGDKSLQLTLWPLSNEKGWFTTFVKERVRTENEITSARATRLYNEMLQNEEGHVKVIELNGQMLLLEWYGRKNIFHWLGGDRFERMNKIGFFGVEDYAFLIRFAKMLILATWGAYKNVKSGKLHPQRPVFQQDQSTQLSFLRYL